MNDPLLAALAPGDVHRTQFSLDALNIYLGSGRCGGCFDAYGLMNSGFAGRVKTGGTPTVLRHADFWHRGGGDNLDSWIPAARLAWAGELPAAPRTYAQSLTLFNGRLTTRLGWPGLDVEITTAFDPYHRDLLAVEIAYEAAQPDAMPDLVFAPEMAIKADGAELAVEAAAVAFEPGGLSALRLRAGTSDGFACLRAHSEAGEVRCHAGAAGTELRFSGTRGRHLLLIALGSWARRAEIENSVHLSASFEDFWRANAASWERRWGNASLQLPDARYQALWARCAFQVLASYGPDPRSPAAPMGWSGVGWARHFPQDVSYIHPALLRMGHLDIARSWVEFYRGELETSRAATRRIYRAEDGAPAAGTMWAWEFPIGPDSHILPNGASNPFQYEIHNAAYPARMAYETARQNGDAAWTREVAWPVVRESARFYASVLRRDGATWGLHVSPSMGQDEYGGENARNYLDALFSARYCLGIALDMLPDSGEALPEAGLWRTMLADGLAFERLRDSESGLLATCEPREKWRLGHQKHPVQLGPAVFLPQGQALTAEARRAFERREDLCTGVREGFYHGWTLAVHWLAASHLGDAAALEAELGKSPASRYVDADWLQIYESSGSNPYYVTSAGLYLQALNDAFVSDYNDGLQLGAACPAGWEGARFDNLCVGDGRVLSGVFAGGEIAWSEEGGALRD